MAYLLWPASIPVSLLKMKGKFITRAFEAISIPAEIFLAGVKRLHYSSQRLEELRQRDS